MILVFEEGFLDPDLRNGKTYSHTDTDFTLR